jgi:hypothetical protein
MKNFLLGAALTLAGSSLAVTWNKDGSLLLSQGDVEQLRIEQYHLQYNFNLAIEQVGELHRQLEELRKAKCS